MGGQDSAAAAAEYVENREQLHKRHHSRPLDVEEGAGETEDENTITAAAKSPCDSSTSGVSPTADDGGNTDLARTLTTSKAYIHHTTSNTTNTNSDDPAMKVGGAGKMAVVHGLNRPLFHIDLTSALQSAVANVESREGREVLGSERF